MQVIDMVLKYNFYFNLYFNILIFGENNSFLIVFDILRRNR